MYKYAALATMVALLVLTGCASRKNRNAQLQAAKTMQGEKAAAAQVAAAPVTKPVTLPITQPAAVVASTPAKPVIPAAAGNPFVEGTMAEAYPELQR